MRKSPQQILFDRVVRTWVAPAAIERMKDPSIPHIPLRMALVRWTVSNRQPDVFLNDEVRAHVASLKIVASGPFAAGPIGPEAIAGLADVRLYKTRRSTPFVFVIQGHNERYYLMSQRTQDVLDTGDFEALRRPLATAGVRLQAAEETLSVFFDVVRNLYDGLDRAGRRRETQQSVASMTAEFRRRAPELLRREREMPVIMVHNDSEFVPLLVEARHTFRDGYFFAAIASAVTTADRICNRLLDGMGADRAFMRRFRQEFTFGQKIEPLRGRKLITQDGERILKELNRIRNRHLHPKRELNRIAQRRDSKRAVLLLHEFLEGSFSVFRDYVIENGRLVPKPLI
jgi:hypothetical protein